VFQTDGGQRGFWYFDSTVWVQAIGPAGAAGPPGPAAGSNPVSHISASTATNITWIQCYTHCLNLEAGSVSPVDATVFTDWRMPNPSEAFFYKSTFDALPTGWLNDNLSNYIWTTDQHNTAGNNSGWYTMNESGNWNGNSTNTSMKCQCVR